MIETAPYIGRTIDVLAFRGGKASGETLLDQSLADENSTGEITTGIQKLAQRFLLTLLTRRGTIKGRPRAGTTFMLKLQQGLIRTEVGLRAAFALAEQTARSQMLAEETPADPADEQYRSATLRTVTITPGFASLTIALRSRQSGANFIVPIPIVV